MMESHLISQRLNYPKIFLAIIYLIIIGAIAWLQGYRWNHTRSYPLGIWRVEQPSIYHPELGQYVIFCPPLTPIFKEAFHRGYILPGYCDNGLTPLLKKIVGLPGDSVEVNRNGVKINNVILSKSTPMAMDSKKRPLPMASGGKIPPGFLWVMSDYYEKSFDSRYFGWIKSDTIEGIIEPVFTWDIP